jgi:hypothetical protein
MSVSLDGGDLARFPRLVVADVDAPSELVAAAMLVLQVYPALLFSLFQEA